MKNIVEAVVSLSTTYFLMDLILKYTAATLYHWPFSPQYVQRTPYGSALIRSRRLRAEGVIEQHPMTCLFITTVPTDTFVNEETVSFAPRDASLNNNNNQSQLDIHNLSGLEPNSSKEQNDWYMNDLSYRFSGLASNRIITRNTTFVISFPRNFKTETKYMWMVRYGFHWAHLL